MIILNKMIIFQKDYLQNTCKIIIFILLSYF